MSVPPDPGPDRPGLAERLIVLTSTVAEAKDWLKARLRDGAQCPVCDQRVQMYRRKITGTMVRALLDMAIAGAHDHPVHMPSVVGSRRADEAKLVYWGLIVEEPGERPDGGRAGYWQVTDAGLDFLAGRTTVDSYALVYNGRCFGTEGTRTTAADCIGEPFDLEELMNGGNHG